MIDLCTVSALFEAVTKTHYVDHRRAVRISAHLHGLRGPAVPKRALELAQELLTRGVQAIMADWPG